MTTQLLQVLDPLWQLPPVVAEQLAQQLELVPGLFSAGRPL